MAHMVLNTTLVHEILFCLILAVCAAREVGALLFLFSMCLVPLPPFLYFCTPVFFLSCCACIRCPLLSLLRFFFLFLFLETAARYRFFCVSLVVVVVVVVVVAVSFSFFFPAPTLRTFGIPFPRQTTPADAVSRKGLVVLVKRRRCLLETLRHRDNARWLATTESLGLRQRSDPVASMGEQVMMAARRARRRDRGRRRRQDDAHGAEQR